MLGIISEQIVYQPDLSQIKDRLWKRIATPPSKAVHTFTHQGIVAGCWIGYFKERARGDFNMAFVEITAPWVAQILDNYSFSSGQELWIKFIAHLTDNGVSDDIIDTIHTSKHKYFRMILDGLRRLSISLPPITNSQKIRGEWFAQLDQHRFASQSLRYAIEMLELGRRDVRSMAEQIWNMCVPGRTVEEREFISKNWYSAYENMIQEEIVRRIMNTLEIIIHEAYY